MAPMVSRSMTDMAADFKGPIGGSRGYYFWELGTMAKQFCMSLKLT